MCWVYSPIANVRNGWKADIAEIPPKPLSDDVIRVVRTITGLSFPDFESGLRLSELVESIAKALETSAHQPTGSALETLVQFKGYPSEFALWWDGFTCELGCSSSCDVNLDALLERLRFSGLFAEA